MEKRTVSLQFLLIKFLLQTGAMVLGLAILCFAMLNIMIMQGWVYAANSGQLQAVEMEQELMGNSSFSAETVPPLVDYKVFNASGEVLGASENTVVRDEWFYETGSITTRKVQLVDGTVVILHWRYRAEFVDDWMRTNLPPFEYLWYAGFILSTLLAVWLMAKRMRRLLAEKLKYMESASIEIGRQNLDFEIVPTRIREFDHVLGAIDEMKSALKEALSQQWRMEQEREREISALAHDLKTPLTIIGGNAELLLAEDLGAEQKKLVAYIESNTERAKSYLTILNSLNHMEAEEMAEIEMSKLVKAVLGAVKPLQIERQQTIIYNEEKAVTLYIKYKKVERALINILENAIRYTDQGGSIQIDIREQADQVLIAVSDSGAGFSEEALLRATERLWKEDYARHDYEHYGLGLWSAKRTMAEHGGELRLMNSDGARVELVFPKRKKGA